jgi:hypothetical protein
MYYFEPVDAFDRLAFIAEWYELTGDYPGYLTFP